MKTFSLESEAYVFWAAVSDFRRDVRLGLPTYSVFTEDMNVIHEMSEYPQIKMRCIDALIAMNVRASQGLLA